MMYKLNIIIEKDEYGYYAYCPELPGCQSEGESWEEVKANIKEAVELYLDTLEESEKQALLTREVLAMTLEVQVGEVALKIETLRQGDAGKVAVTLGQEYVGSHLVIVVPTALFLTEYVVATVPIKIANV
ncbi:MAG: type II toxin-antitoxin system HicB family antitoxin [Hormoscilla sp. GUM202]|nr:type II toxin-antitoxin system HicB family antitoxin [Hormoscilla sp. GUM202]